MVQTEISGDIQAVAAVGALLVTAWTWQFTALMTAIRDLRSEGISGRERIHERIDDLQREISETHVGLVRHEADCPSRGRP